MLKCIQGYIVLPKLKKKKKAYRDNPTGTDNQRVAECLIVPLPVLIVLVMVPWRDYTRCRIKKHNGIEKLSRQIWHNYNTKCDKQTVSEHNTYRIKLTKTGWQKYLQQQLTRQVLHMSHNKNCRVTKTCYFKSITRREQLWHGEKSKQANLFISWHSKKLTLKCCNQQ